MCRAEDWGVFWKHSQSPTGRSCTESQWLTPTLAILSLKPALQEEASVQLGGGVLAAVRHHLCMHGLPINQGRGGDAGKYECDVGREGPCV